MSMQKMRENTKTILWVVVISFVVTIFAVWGMDITSSSHRGNPNEIGKVDGVSISRTQFQRLYDQMLKSITGDNPDQEIPYSQREMISEQAWRNIVYNILTKKEIKKLGITVSDEEIMKYLRETPPVEVQQYFLDDNGDFDKQKYLAALNNPEIDWSSLKDLARQRLPLLKLQAYLQSLVHVSNAEVRRAYEEKNTLMSAAYVEFPMPDVDPGNYSPSSDEIQAYYSANRDKFKEPEKAALEVISFDLAPAERDISSAKFTADMVRDQIAGGEDFGEMAKTYSQSPTASAGGETGFLREGQREDEFFKVADSLAVGELSLPIRTQSGYYIIKVLEKKQGRDKEKEFKVREIFIKISAGYETVDSLQTLAQEFLEKARGEGFEKAAADMQLKIAEPKPFAKNFPIEGFGFVPKLSNFAFSAEEGHISNIMRDDRRIYVAKLKKKLPESVKPLAEVRDSIVSELKRKKREQAAYAKASEFYNQAQASSFEEAAAKSGLRIKRLDDFHISDDLEGFGSYSAFATAAFSVAEGSFTSPILDGNSYYVIKLVKRAPFNEEDYKKKMKAIGESLYQEKAQRFLAYWYQSLEDKSKIEDYRNQ